MKWIKFTLDTTTQAVDLISAMLSDLGIEGIEIVDKVQLSEEDKKHMFVDILPDLGEDDGSAQISFYADTSENITGLLEKVKEGLKELSEYVPVGSCRITTSETEDKDWVNNWKEFFKPFRVDDTIVVKPTWEKLEKLNENDLVIEIDPGAAFGTGAHETTKLCMIALKYYLKPDSVVLDAGSGSGILSILAKKLGAREVVGIDIDPMATDTAKENATVNGLRLEKGSLNFLTGNIIGDENVRTLLGKNKYDMVVANILADVIIPLAAVVRENLKSGGLFITSGIINTKEEEVRQAILKNGFTILKTDRMGDWVVFVSQRI